MLRTLGERVQSEESGFTLLEILVVVLIIGILAGLGITAFLGQQRKGQDVDAKAQARNLVSQVESCFVDSAAGAYTDCDQVSELGSTGLNVVNGNPAPGAVSLTPVGPKSSGYVAVAHSESGTYFAIGKDPTTGSTSRNCGSLFDASTGTASPVSSGGCRGANGW